MKEANMNYAIRTLKAERFQLEKRLASLPREVDEHVAEEAVDLSTDIQELTEAINLLKRNGLTPEEMVSDIFYPSGD